MNVGDLRSKLRNLDDDLEVKLATQPAYPFEYNISDVMLVSRADHLELMYQAPAEDLAAEDGGWFVIDCHEDPQDDEHWVDGPFKERDEAEARLERFREEEPAMLYIVEGYEQEYLKGEARRAIGW